VDSVLHWVRRRQHALTRAVLALFCLAWLQAAALPCAMAQAASQAAAGDHCPYCPTSDLPASSSDHQETCAYPHQPQADARAAALLFVAIPATPVLQHVDATGVACGMSRSASPGPVPGVPLAVSYCRYIE
jgi:hypothetical protein